MRCPRCSRPPQENPRAHGPGGQPSSGQGLREPGLTARGQETAASAFPLVSRSPTRGRTRTRGSPPSRTAEKLPRHAHSPFPRASGPWPPARCSHRGPGVARGSEALDSGACRAPSWLWGAELGSSVGVWGSGYPRTRVSIRRVNSGRVYHRAVCHGTGFRLDPGFPSAGLPSGRAGYDEDVYGWTAGGRLGAGFVWEGLTLRSTSELPGLRGAGGRQLARRFRCRPGFTGRPRVTSVQRGTGPGAYLGCLHQAPVYV